MPLAGRFNGTICPNKLNFGRVHGTSPATGSVELDGTFTLPLGSVASLQIGAATFVGIVIRNEQQYNATEADETSVIKMVDWRDRLHDKFVFAAFNMQDNLGRFYHIFPVDWEDQKKTFLNKELEEQDFNDVQLNLVDDLETVGTSELLSGFMLLNKLSEQFDFNWTASPVALRILAIGRPENLDWNSGVKAVDAIQQICEKNGLQFTVFGARHLHVTLRGFSENSFVNAFLSGSASICDIGGSSGSRGTELNVRGRRVLIIGDHSKNEYTFPCVPDWNSRWTLSFCYDYGTLAAFLFANGVTRHSKLSELPLEYRDPYKFNDEDRNDLTVQEYIDKVAWHVYVVDGLNHVDGLQPRREDINEITVMEFDRENAASMWIEVPDYPTGRNAWGALFNPVNDEEEAIRDAVFNGQNFLFPISDSLVTNSDIQFRAYCTEQFIHQGNKEVFEQLRVFIPQESGAKLSVESILNPDDGREEYRVRLIFDKVTDYIPPEVEGKERDKLLTHETDLPLCRLCINKELYTYVAGEGGDGIRVREQRKKVKNLYKAYVNGAEQSVLRLNFREQILKGPGPHAVDPVKPDEIAQRIAAQLLFHEAVTKSGSVQYEEMAGAVCDGIIDTVNTSWNATTGATENVSMSSGFLDDSSEISFGIFNQKRDVHTDEDINREIMQNILLEMMREAGVAPGVAGRVQDDVVAQSGGNKSGIKVANTFGKDGAILVAVPKDLVEKEDEIAMGQVLVVGPAGTA